MSHSIGWLSIANLISGSKECTMIPMQIAPRGMDPVGAPHASSSLSLRERHSFNQLKWTAERRSRNGESHTSSSCAPQPLHTIYIPLSRHEKQKKPEEELTPADQNVVANLR